MTKMEYLEKYQTMYIRGRYYKMISLKTFKKGSQIPL